MASIARLLLLSLAEKAVIYEHGTDSVHERNNPTQRNFCIALFSKIQIAFIAEKWVAKTIFNANVRQQTRSQKSSPHFA